MDDCRIPFVDDTNKGSAKPLGKTLKHKGWDTEKWLEETKEPHSQGRFTPNLLVCDDMLNDGVITKQSKRTYKPTEHMGSLFGNSPQAHGVGIGDSGSSSRYYDLDLWFDKMLESL